MTDLAALKRRLRPPNWPNDIEAADAIERLEADLVAAVVGAGRRRSGMRSGIGGCVNKGLE